MNILPPFQNPALLGHDAALKQIADAYASGRMHHAWLVTGIEGIGKATLAYHVAHFILSDGKNALGKPNMQHPASKLIAAEAHPDLFVLRRPIDDKSGEPKDVIPAEDARKIAPFLHMTASLGGWRMAIIDEAHTLNRHGQNAILKVIEEPPKKCVIVLTATAAGGLLPTIRSRCRILPLQPLNENVMRAVLARCDVDERDQANLSRVIQLSSGSAGFALKMLENEALPLYEELMALLQNFETARLHALADKMSRKADADSFAVITQLLVDHLRRNARDLAGQTPVSAQLDRALQLWDKVKQTFAMAAGANLDRKLAFINAIMEIRRAA
jgi:DNA polymerase-3 subunit delta'